MSGEGIGLICRGGEFKYQLLSDDRALYVVRLGLEDGQGSGRAIASVEEFQLRRGCYRLKRSEIDEIRCMVCHGETRIDVVRGGRRHRFICDGVLREAALRSVFSGFRLSVENRGQMERPGRNGLEWGLLVACVMAGMIRALVSLIVGTGGAVKLWGVVWVVVPILWLLFCAGGAHDDKKGAAIQAGGMQLGPGTLAWLLSCLLLVTAYSGTLTHWEQVILPTLIVVAVIAGCAWGIRRRISRVQMATVLLVSMLLYAPFTVLWLNGCLPAQNSFRHAAEVLELGSTYVRGNLKYYAVAEVEGIQGEYELTYGQHTILEEGGTMELVYTIGALGIETMDISCRPLAAEAQTETAQTESPQVTELHMEAAQMN